MLVLSRKTDQQLVIELGEETVLVRVLDVNGDRVRFGITAVDRGLKASSFAA